MVVLCVRLVRDVLMLGMTKTAYFLLDCTIQIETLLLSKMGLIFNLSCLSRILNRFLWLMGLQGNSIFNLRSTRLRFIKMNQY